MLRFKQGAESITAILDRMASEEQWVRPFHHLRSNSLTALFFICPMSPRWPVKAWSVFSMKYPLLFALLSGSMSALSFLVQGFAWVML